MSGVRLVRGREVSHVTVHRADTLVVFRRGSWFYLVLLLAPGVGRWCRRSACYPPVPVAVALRASTGGAGASWRGRVDRSGIDGPGHQEPALGLV